MSVLVVDAGNTGRHALSQAASRLAAVGGELGGVVLNRADSEDGYYGYSYYASYTEEEKAPRGRRRGKQGEPGDAGRPSAKALSARRPPVRIVRGESAEQVWGDEPAQDRPADEPVPDPGIGTSIPPAGARPESSPAREDRPAHEAPHGATSAPTTAPPDTRPDERPASYGSPSDEDAPMWPDDAGVDETRGTVHR